MPSDNLEPSISVQLASLIERANAISESKSAAFVVGHTWIHRVRIQLSRIYGEGSSQVDYWCSPQSTDSDIRELHRRLEPRIARLKQFLTILAISDNPNKIFVGHGPSSEWLKLSHFLANNLKLECDEFNIEPAAGLQTANRIEQMLRSARMALLVMTADDQHNDGTYHARENVVHEIGLFQSRLGPLRAIVLLEQGCKRFSNLDGLTTIDFPKGDIMARSEKIREVLVREKVLPGIGA